MSKSVFFQFIFYLLSLFCGLLCCCGYVCHCQFTRRSKTRIFINCIDLYLDFLSILRSAKNGGKLFHYVRFFCVSCNLPDLAECIRVCALSWRKCSYSNNYNIILTIPGRSSPGRTNAGASPTSCKFILQRT